MERDGGGTGSCGRKLYGLRVFHRRDHPSVRYEAFDRKGRGLRDKRFFTENLTVLNSTVAWDLSGCYDPANCIDIDPFELYEAEVVEDPFREAV